VTAAIGTALASGTAYALIGAGVAVVATATRTLHLAVGQVLVAGVLAQLVLGSAASPVPLLVAGLLAVLLGALLSAALEPLVLTPLPEGCRGCWGWWWRPACSTRGSPVG
jgi:branched-subunit amino acid ABC-type transport system permease component